ncbi:hypothetical protein G6O69_13020 [Pseudenhygromyxa sp. WMMC2535]|uniref:hypothetical protein n=1 Tax=Pseudenhygromyxa sp. WMMC2535 TaxID=2712867 RepID=UPI0015575AE4|nr:hypothetical protein [Pseudenhygromyxa sp. WMMC2535]NVB38755.1 hypothetical protein [Pseudenhygromyxa sp. WMMC2535]
MATLMGTRVYANGKKIACKASDGKLVADRPCAQTGVMGLSQPQSDDMADYQEIPVMQAQALVAEKAPWLEGYADFRRHVYPWTINETVIRLYPGDVVFDGDFAAGPDSVLVAGSLKVSGLLTDCHEADRMQLYVLGDVEARDLMSFSEVVIGGAACVERLVYLNSLNDYSFSVYGDLSADGLVEEGMDSWVGGEIEARHVLSLQNQIRQGRGEQERDYPGADGDDATEVFLPEFLDDGYPKMAEILAALREGRIVLK